MPDPVSLAAPLHRGVVQAPFSLVWRAQLLSYRAGQPVEVDTLLRDAIAAAGGEVRWADDDVVPGLAFAHPAAPVPVGDMRPGVIYAADAVVPDAAKAAQAAGDLAEVTLRTKGADPVRGWVRAR